jgi:hypothetical protein
MNRPRNVTDYQLESGDPMDPATRHNKTMYLVLLSGAGRRLFRRPEIAW